MDNQKVIEIISNVLSQLNLDQSQFKIEILESENINITLDIPQDVAGVFVGRHGETLASLRMVFSLILFQRYSIWPKIHLNVNDYQERREEALREIADTAVQKALSLKKEIILPNLSSYERRLIHMYLSERNDIKTESRGVPPLRQMVVIPQ